MRTPPGFIGAVSPTTEFLFSVMCAASHAACILPPLTPARRHNAQLRRLLTIMCTLGLQNMNWLGKSLYVPAALQAAAAWCVAIAMGAGIALCLSAFAAWQWMAMLWRRQELASCTGAD
jgi:hypothetical protein